MGMVKNHYSTDSEYITFRQAWEILDLPIYYLMGDKYIRLDHTNIQQVQDRLIAKLRADHKDFRYLIVEWFTEEEI